MLFAVKSISLPYNFALCHYLVCIFSIRLGWQSCNDKESLKTLDYSNPLILYFFVIL